MLCAAALLLAAACDADLSWLGRGSAAEASDGAAAALVNPGENGDVHIVRLVARGDAYAFEPAELRVRRGDVIRFVQTSYQPENVVFDSIAVPVGATAALRESGLFAGPLLTVPGAAWDVRFPDVPPGVYPFVSVPHAAFGMRGAAVVVP